MNFAIARRKMIKEQLLEPSGDRPPVLDKRVVEVISSLPRHIFVQEALAMQAYNDTSLPIGEKQTISQPYIVAKMTELLDLHPDDKVLEIGTGSGYQTAVLASLAEKVCTMERIRSLATRARKSLDSLKLFNVMMKINDTPDSPIGWEEEAPFDAIIITAGAPAVPLELLSQLATGGRMVVPVGDESEQQLYKLVKGIDGEIVQSSSTPCRFVPLIGRSGWSQ